jgi:hypothetical protein
LQPDYDRRVPFLADLEVMEAGFSGVTFAHRGKKANFGHAPGTALRSLARNRRSRETLPRQRADLATLPQGER